MKGMRHVVRFLSSSAGLWVTSAVAAFLVWYGIARISRNESVIRNVPVEVRTAPGWHLAGRDAPVVDVTFRGSPADLRLVTKDNIRIVLDARKHETPEPLTVPTARLEVDPPRGVSLSQVKPESLTVTLLPGD